MENVERLKSIYQQAWKEANTYLGNSALIFWAAVALGVLGLYTDWDLVVLVGICLYFSAILVFCMAGVAWTPAKNIGRQLEESAGIDAFTEFIKIPENDWSKPVYSSEAADEIEEMVLNALFVFPAKSIYGLLRLTWSATLWVLKPTITRVSSLYRGVL